MDLVLPTAQDLGQNLDRQRADWKANDAHRREWLPAHGVYVGECVGRGDLTEEIRIVDDGREEVDGLDEREVLGQPEDPRVVEGLTTNENSGIGSRVQRREGAGQVTRTQLGGSTGAASELGESERLGAKVGHRDSSKVE